jgi:ABC-type Fe3+ transport system substrate-binding protein
MTYSTERVKKSDLPKTWNDLITNPKFQNGRVGMATNANTWLALFAGKFGNEWAFKYMDDMFSILKPQLRKERLNAISKLASLGEFDIAIPQSESQAKSAMNRGLKVGFHCPDPVAVNGTVMAVLKGSPNENAAKVWVNWMLSREGQLAHFTFDNTGPSHEALRPLKAFSHFPDIVLPTPKAFLDGKALANMPVVMKRWQRKWTSSGGPSRKRGKRKRKKAR